MIPFQSISRLDQGQANLLSKTSADVQALIGEFLEAGLHTIAYNRGLLPIPASIKKVLEVPVRILDSAEIQTYFTTIVQGVLTNWFKPGVQACLSLLISTRSKNHTPEQVEEVAFELKVSEDLQANSTIDQLVFAELKAELGSALLKLQTDHSPLSDLPQTNKTFRILLLSDLLVPASEWPQNSLPLLDLTSSSANQKSKTVHSFHWENSDRSMLETKAKQPQKTPVKDISYPLTFSVSCGSVSTNEPLPTLWKSASLRLPP